MSPSILLFFLNFFGHFFPFILFYFSPSPQQLNSILGLVIPNNLFVLLQTIFALMYCLACCLRRVTLGGKVQGVVFSRSPN